LEIGCIFHHFGKLYQEKSGNPAVHPIPGLPDLLAQHTKPKIKYTTLPLTIDNKYTILAT
jgi:hypothetical protein